MKTLNDKELAALHEALADEYRAWSTYDQVINDFGEVRPFIHIRDAEARHIQALHALFESYGMAIPENEWPGRIQSYPSLHKACEAGVAAEIDNGDMYERLLCTTQRADILNVFRHLRRASQQNHLPAFQRCVARSQ